MNVLKESKRQVLLDRMDEFGIKAIDLAREIGISRSRMSEILSGRRTSLETAVKLCNRLGVPLYSGFPDLLPDGFNQSMNWGGEVFDG